MDGARPMMAVKARIGLDPRLRKAAAKNEYGREFLELIERKVHLVAQYPKKYLRKYQSHSDVWEWKIFRGDRVFLRDARSDDGKRTLVVVGFGKHDLHRKYRRAGTHFASVPLEYELLTT